MGGLLRAIAGGLKGYGDAMIDQAKQAREDAVAALLRSNQVADRDAGFAQQNKVQAVTEQGANTRLATSEAGATDRTSITETGANTRLGISEAGANKRTSITEGGANARNAATLKAEGDRQAAGFTHDDNAFTDIKPQADGTYVAFSKNGQGQKVLDKNTGAPIVAPTGNAVPASVSAAIFKAHTTLDPETSQPVVDTDAALADLAKAEKQYATRPDAVTPTVLSSAPMPGAGATGLTSNLFGKTPLTTLSATPAPPQAAIDYLKANRGQASAFDQKYGQGAAARALGQ